MTLLKQIKKVTLNRINYLNEPCPSANNFKKYSWACSWWDTKCWLIDWRCVFRDQHSLDSAEKVCFVHLAGKSWAVHVDEKVYARDHCCRCDKCLWWWPQAHLWLCVLPLSFVTATRQLRLYAEEYLTHRDITFAYYLCVFHPSLLVDRFSARYIRTSISVKYIFTQRKHPICIYCQQGNLNEMSLFFFFYCIPRISRLFC